MFRDWDEYYLLVGGAAGALIGLLFVVVTLTAGLRRDTVERGQSVFMTPTVVHFAAVLTVAALAMAPGVPPRVAGALLIGLGGLGALYAAVTTWRLRTGEIVHWSDSWGYGVAPLVFYLALAVAGGAALAAPRPAAYAVAAASLALLFTGVRNAWDLITWIVPRRGAADPAAEP
jgi:hypothetical protein